MLSLVTPISQQNHLFAVDLPASTQYGSDALGGTIGVFAESPVIKGSAKANGTLGLTLGAANRLRSSDVGAGLMRGGVALRVAGSVGAASELRAGGGLDSHSAVTRFLGLPSTEIGDTLENTGYSQSGISASARVPIRNGRNLTLSYRRAEQAGSHRYDQEMGGNGRYRSEFGPRIFWTACSIRSCRPSPAVSASASSTPGPWSKTTAAALPSRLVSHAARVP